MIIDLTDLIIGNVDNVDVDGNVIIDDSYFINTSIKKLYDTHFVGNVVRIGDGYQLKGVISGVMVLPDDVTLLEVDYSYEIDILEDFDDNDDIFKIVQNKLDITDYLWQNILVEVPSKVRDEKNKDISLKGDGWRLVSEDEVDSCNDSPFSELSKMFDSGKE